MARRSGPRRDPRSAGPTPGPSRCPTVRGRRRPTARRCHGTRPIERPPVEAQRTSAAARHPSGRGARPARTWRRARRSEAPSRPRRGSSARKVEPSELAPPAVTRLNEIAGVVVRRRPARSRSPASSRTWRGGSARATATTTPQIGRIGRQEPVGSTISGVHGPAATTTSAAAIRWRRRPARPGGDADPLATRGRGCRAGPRRRAARPIARMRSSRRPARPDTRYRAGTRRRRAQTGSRRWTASGDRNVGRRSGCETTRASASGRTPSTRGDAQEPRRLRRQRNPSSARYRRRSRGAGRPGPDRRGAGRPRSCVPMPRQRCAPTRSARRGGRQREMRGRGGADDPAADDDRVERAPPRPLASTDHGRAPTRARRCGRNHVRTGVRV